MTMGVHMFVKVWCYNVVVHKTISVDKFMAFVFELKDILSSV